MAEVHFKVAQRLAPLLNERILRFAQLHTQDSLSAREMFADQFVYGHREILLKYSGLDYSNQIIGVLQHGIYFPGEELDFLTPRFIGGRKTKRYVFSKKYQQIALSLGHKNVYPIGAPWLYLKLGLDSTQTFLPPEKKSVLIMPSHSQTALPDNTSTKAKLGRAKLFRDAIGPMDATVCLHPVDFLDPNARMAFTEYGFEVTCIGGTPGLAWSPSGGRVTALSYLYKLMKQHTHYLTDTVGTSLFYAINIGMRVGIFPEIRNLVNYSPLEAGVYKDEETKQLDYDFGIGHFANAINQFTPSSEFIEITNQMLGADCLLGPMELKEVLDYRSGVYPKDMGAEPW
jgi:hypothetical protein